MFSKAEPPFEIGQRVRHKRAGREGVVDSVQQQVPLLNIRFDGGLTTCLSQRRLEKVEAVYAGIDMASKPDRTAVWYSTKEYLERNQPLTFSVKHTDGNLWPAHDLQEAVLRTRLGWKLKPNRPLTGNDFADYGDRILLAELGYFSCDLPAARAKRDREAQRAAYIEEAYDVLHLDRNEQHALIARKLEAKRFDGIWAKSTGEYSEACRRLDDFVLRASPAIAKSVDELDADAGSVRP